MKGCNVTVKKNHKAFFYTIVKRLGFDRKLMVNSLVSMVIAFLRSFCTCDHFRIRWFMENRDSTSIFIIFLLKPDSLVKLLKNVG